MINSHFQKISKRLISIHEYQSMDIMREYEIPVPDSVLAKNSDEAENKSKSLSGKDGKFVVKAQVLAGGRGKGEFTSGLKGGVQIIQGSTEVGKVAKKMIGNNLVTKQTGKTGRPCNSVMIAKWIKLDKMYYIAILLDRNTKRPMLMGSRKGGVDIEGVAKETPEEIVTLAIEGDELPSLKDFAKKIEIKESSLKEFTSCVERLFKLFKEKDATLLEINPLVLTKDDKRLVCLDAKINIDDNAHFRQKEIFDKKDDSQQDPREVRAAKSDLNYIGLDGQIGCLVNGAGLAMATMDIIKLHGGDPANFLDVGGSASEEQVEESIRILGEDERVKAIMVNIFGGIMRCDVIARGLIKAVHKTKLEIPLVVRLLGTNVVEAKKILAESGLEIIACDDLAMAAEKAVILSKIVELGQKADVKLQIKGDIGSKK